MICKHQLYIYINKICICLQFQNIAYKDIITHIFFWNSTLNHINFNEKSSLDKIESENVQKTNFSEYFLSVLYHSWNKRHFWNIATKVILLLAQKSTWKSKNEGQKRKKDTDNLRCYTTVRIIVYSWNIKLRVIPF